MRLTLAVSRCLESRVPLESAFPSHSEAEEGGDDAPSPSWCAIQACLAQLVGHRARRNAKTHRARLGAYVGEWRAGRALVDVARGHDHSPWLLARDVVLAEAAGGDKHVAQDMLRNVDHIPDHRLREDVRVCMEEDLFFSPHHDRARRAAGLQFEYKLQRELLALNVAFETEEALRRRGFSKTPDVLLVLPVAFVVDAHTPPRVVRWIDSKAMYGDLTTHNEDNRDQLQSYVNRFGPGLVVYWMGFDPEIQITYPDVMVHNHVPKEFISL